MREYFFVFRNISSIPISKISACTGKNTKGFWVREPVRIGDIVLANVAWDGLSRNIYSAKSWLSFLVSMNVTEGEYKGLKPCSSFGLKVFWIWLSNSLASWFILSLILFSVCFEFPSSDKLILSEDSRLMVRVMLP